MHCLLMNGQVLVRSVCIRNYPPLSVGRCFLCFVRLVSPHFMRSLSGFPSDAWLGCMMISPMLRNRLRNPFRHTIHIIVDAGIMITGVPCSASLQYACRCLSDAPQKIHRERRECRDSGRDDRLNLSMYMSYPAHDWLDLHCQDANPALFQSAIKIEVYRMDAKS